MPFENSTYLDAAAGLTLLMRELEHIETRVRRQEFPDLKSQILIPLVSDVGPGDETTTHQVYTASGVAKFCASNATVYPMVDIASELVTSRIHHSIQGTGYTLQELRAASKSSLPLDATRLIELRHTMEVLADKTCFVGDATMQIFGLLNHPNAIRQLAAYAMSGSTTAAQARATLDAALLAQINLTAGKGLPDTMILPRKVWQFLKNIYRQSTSNKTVLDEFLEANPEIKAVEIVEWMNVAQNGIGDFIVFYSSDPMHIGQIFPLGYTPGSPILEGVFYKITAEMRHGGIKAYFPLYLNVIELPAS